jgi:hypothetical protein
MADREDQPQPLVGNRAHELVAFVGLVAPERAQLGLERGAPSRPAALGPDPVERAVARGGDDPARRIVREAVAGPALERGEEGVLDGLLGAIEVAEDAGEDGDRLSRLTPEQAVDEDVPGAGQEAVASATPPWACSAS